MSVWIQWMRVCFFLSYLSYYYRLSSRSLLLPILKLFLFYRVKFPLISHFFTLFPGDMWLRRSDSTVTDTLPLRHKLNLNFFHKKSSWSDSESIQGTLRGWFGFSLGCAGILPPQEGLLIVWNHFVLLMPLLFSWCFRCAHGVHEHYSRCTLQCMSKQRAFMCR